MASESRTRASFVRWGAALVVIAAAATLVAAQSASPTPPPNSARAALFTQAQATNGEAVYAKACAACHGAALTGGAAPPLTGPAFARSWGDPRVTLDDLFFVIRTTMPPNNLGALSAPERAAVFAHILKTNGYPAGAVPLAADSPQLREQRLRVAAVPPADPPPPPAFIPGAAGARSATSVPANRRSTRLNALATGCSTTTITPAPASRPSPTSRLRTPRGCRRPACFKWASATTFKRCRSCIVA